MRKINKQIEKTISKKINESFFTNNFNSENTLLDFVCASCNAKYSFDVMAVYFDSLRNKEKFLVNPVCPFCGERENFKYQNKTLHFLSFLYKDGHMKEALFQEEFMKELCSLYPDEHLSDVDHLDEEGLNALEKGDYPEVFRIFTQFIYINPHHNLGFEFIAYAYYENREFEKSIYFMEKAVERAEMAAANDRLDKGLLSVIKKNLEYMKRHQLIFRWWENL